MIGFSCYTNTDDKIMEAMCNHAKQVARGQAQVPKQFINEQNNINKPQKTTTTKQKVVKGLAIAAAIAGTLLLGKLLLKKVPSIDKALNKNISFSSILKKGKDFVINSYSTISTKVKNFTPRITDFVKNLFKAKKP